MVNSGTSLTNEPSYPLTEEPPCVPDATALLPIASKSVANRKQFNIKVDQAQLNGLVSIDAESPTGGQQSTKSCSQVKFDQFVEKVKAVDVGGEVLDPKTCIPKLVIYGHC